MRKILSVFALILGLSTTGAFAQTVPLDTLQTEGGAAETADGLEFRDFGASARTSTLSSILTPGTTYDVQVSGTGGRALVASYPTAPNVPLDLGLGRTVSFFILAEAGGELKLTRSGDAAQGTGTVTGLLFLAVPAPLAGAGLVPALGAFGIWLRRRRRRSARRA